MIPERDWVWYGKAAHLCVGHDCRFHLATEIGNVVVSTVGEYFPDSRVRKMLADSRGEDFMEYADRYEEIGCGRLYETMVFRKNGKVCECGCGMPQTGYVELDMDGYNTAALARAGHMAMCRRAASGVYGVQS